MAKAVPAPSVEKDYKPMFKREKFETDYLRGYDVHLYFNQEIWNLSPYNRDEWAKSYLNSRGLPIYEETHLHRKFEGGNIVGMIITTFYYKPEIYRLWILNDKNNADFWRSLQEKTERNMKLITK